MHTCQSSPQYRSGTSLGYQRASGSEKRLCAAGGAEVPTLHFDTTPRPHSAERNLPPTDVHHPGGDGGDGTCQ